MANPIIYTVTMPSGNVYDLVDQGARDLIKELMNFREWLGVTTTEIEDGSTTNPITIEGESVTAVAGDVVSRSSDHADFIYSSTGIWQNFGNLEGLGALAFKDSASGSYTPTGTVSQPTFSGTAFTPAGTVSQPTFTGTEVTPAGTISTVKAFKTAGTLATCVMPTFTVSNGNLSITDGTYTAATLPEGEDVTPTFTGTAFTPTGTVSQPSFTGTEVTPAGTVSQPSFTGTPANITVS